MDTNLREQGQLDLQPAHHDYFHFETIRLMWSVVYNIFYFS